MFSYKFVLTSGKISPKWYGNKYKICPKCQRIRPVRLFGWMRNKGSFYYPVYCVECGNLYQSEYRKKTGHIHQYQNQKAMITTRLRTRLYQALKKNQRAGSAVRDLGCTIPELRIHLENQFRDEMNWENYGSYWEIDHIRPLSSFNLSDREEFLQAVHYTNLQPLTVEENRSKGARNV